jgi:hypothetical protein
MYLVGTAPAKLHSPDVLLQTRMQRGFVTPLQESIVTILACYWLRPMSTD